MEHAVESGDGVSVAGRVIALPAARWRVDPWTWVLGLLAAGVSRGWIGLGLLRLARLARTGARHPYPAFRNTRSKAAMHLGLLAAGVIVRLGWIGLGLLRLARLARTADRIAAVARDLLARFRVSAVFVRIRTSGCPAPGFRPVPADGHVAGRL